MKRLTTCLLVLFAALFARAKDVHFKGLVITLAKGISAEVAPDTGLLMIDWGNAGPASSPLFVSLVGPATNAQAQIAARVGIYVMTQTQILKAVSPLKSLRFQTNQVNLGPHQVTELLVTAKYRDRDFGTMSQGYWFFATGGKLWQADMPEGAVKDAGRVRSILSGVRPETDTPDRPDPKP